jgi:hypothetical protein
MKNEGWPIFSITDLLRPAEGWKVDHAVLTTYSADLTVIVTALLALAGCDLDNRRTGSRVELVRAIEALRGRVCVLAQANRIAVPKSSRPRPILKLLDQFVRVVATDEKLCSWHPKSVLVRYSRIGDSTNLQWRCWLGSRNLTSAMNWDAGVTLASRQDGRGQKIEGLADLGGRLTSQAKFGNLSAVKVSAELGALTWDAPPGCEMQKINFLGPDLANGLPRPSVDTERIIVFSPFLDLRTVRAIAGWGNSGTRRTLVSTQHALQSLHRENGDVFNGLDKVCMLPPPELPVQGADLPGDDEALSSEIAESEDSPPAGLHAKLFFAAKGARRKLWIGSANATQRAWTGRNYEVIAEMLIGRDSANAIEEFAIGGELFKPNPKLLTDDEAEKVLEDARMALSGTWSIIQRIGEAEVEVVASMPPPIEQSSVQMEVATLGGEWSPWPRGATAVVLPSLSSSHRSDFIQIRLTYGGKMCAWLQIASCDPAPDQGRDRALIAQYLDPRSFLLWLRSVLADEPAYAGGGDWDDDNGKHSDPRDGSRKPIDLGSLLTVEDILRAWARDRAAFAAVDEKVVAYLRDIESAAAQRGQADEARLLQTFQQTWNALATELR